MQGHVRLSFLIHAPIFVTLHYPGETLRMNLLMAALRPMKKDFADINQRDSDHTLKYVGE